MTFARALDSKCRKVGSRKHLHKAHALPWARMCHGLVDEVMDNLQENHVLCNTPRAYLP